MKSFSLTTCALLLGTITLFSGCADVAAKSDAPPKPKRYVMYEVIITITDDESNVRMKKRVTIPNTDYEPTIERATNSDTIFKWYVGYYGGGSCVVKPGWLFEWTQPNRLEAPKADYTSEDLPINERVPDTTKQRLAEQEESPKPPPN